MSIRVFFSYRRQDNPALVKAIRDEFVLRYKSDNVFIDYDSIPPAAKWQECIERNIANCDVFVLIVGIHWLELLNEKVSSNQPDYVIYEIEQAIYHEKIIAPICIDDARLPKLTNLPESIHSLYDFHAASLSDGQDFPNRCKAIMDSIENQLLSQPSLSVYPLRDAATSITVRLDIPAQHFHADSFVLAIQNLMPKDERDDDIAVIKIDDASNLLVELELPQKKASRLIDLFESDNEKLLKLHILEVLPKALLDFRYQLLSKLGGGGMGTVYKAHDRVNNEIVALKKVKPQVGADTRFDRNILLALSHEFKILSRMRHPYIIGVLDYGFIGQDEPYFTMEYVETPTTIVDYAQPAPHNHRLRVLVEALEALRYMHWQQFLHRDLKPPNILVTDNHVKVLDFGISIMKQYRAEITPAGTIAYMSPEALIEENAHNLKYASDLWSMGVIAYEIFIGNHPYDSNETHVKINRILTEDPDWDELDVDERLLKILRQFLEKDANQRYQDAETVIKHLHEAAMPSRLNVDPQNESYLQTAPFTGREAELVILRQTLEAAVNKKGSMYLIKGDAGVGKSRLIEELRIEALVDGVVVLRGASTSETASPYYLWRAIVRRLCLMVNLTDLQAGILKAIVPDIEELIGRYLPPVPDLLEPNAARIRLFDTIDLLIRNCPRPLLLLLEDLHWAGEDSLALLKHIEGGLSNRQVFVVGTFRTLHGSNLHEQFPDVPLMRLDALPEQAVEELVEKILHNNEVDTEVMLLLKQESRGNAFSLVEIIRAMAEHSDGITNIGLRPIPEAIFRQGITTIVQSRLRRLQEADRFLLQLAAVAGQDVDLALLRLLQPEQLEQWLRTCAVNNILEVDDGQWRFSHNRLREVLLGTLQSEQSQELHGRIAQSKVQLYGSDESHYAAIAMHWEAAAQFDKAGEWYFKAAQVAEAAHSTAQAVELYQKALDYLTKDDLRRWAIGEKMGKLLRWQAKFDAAWDVLNITHKLATAQLLNGMSDVRQDEGRLDEALTLTEAAENAAREAGVAGREVLLDALNNKAWTNILLGDLAQAQQVVKESLLHAVDWDYPRQHTTFLNRMGQIQAMLGNTEAAFAYLDDALKLAEGLKDERLIAVTLTNFGEVYRMDGQTETAISHFKQALDLHEKLGGYDGKLIVSTNLSGCYIDQQDYQSAAECTHRVFDILNTREWWGLIEAYPNHIKALYEIGEYDEAMGYADNWHERTIRRDKESEKDALKAFAQTWLERANERGNRQEIQLVKTWLTRLEKI